MVAFTSRTTKQIRFSQALRVQTVDRQIGLLIRFGEMRLTARLKD